MSVFSEESPRRPVRLRTSYLASLSLLVPAVLAGLSACNSTDWPDREPSEVDANADTLVFWPASVTHALPGELPVTVVRGLRRVYACAEFVQLGWEESDSASATRHTLRARLRLPALPSCALAPAVDTVLPPADTTHAGGVVHLRKADGTVTDSVRIVAGGSETRSFTRVRDPEDTVQVESFGEFTFYDSTAERPQRSLRADSLDTCEALESAVFDREGDTLTVRFRLLRADSVSSDVFPACAGGPRVDSVEVVFNRHGYPHTAVPLDPPAP